MEKLRFSMLWAMVALIAIIISCTQETGITPQEEQSEVGENVRSAFYKLGFDASDMTIETVTNAATGITEEVYILEGDIIISKDKFQEMLEDAENAGPSTEQYRTTNLVSSPRTIRVLGFSGSGSNAGYLDATMRSGLQMAVENYNNLNLGLSFTLAFGTNTSGYDIVVRRVGGSGGGRAGFPSGGRPFNSVTIQAGTSNFGLNVVEHVMTHEIGHCVGLRHTDYFNRSISCGSGGNEGPAGVGAIHIPGTPTTTNVDLNSVMLACFDANETGEFSPFDATALRTLYPGGNTGGGTFLNVSTSSVRFGSNAGRRIVSVSSDGSWSVSDNAGWITVTPTNGSNNGNITINVRANNRLCEPRFGVVTVNGGSAGSKTINVLQFGRRPRPGEFCP